MAKFVQNGKNVGTWSAWRFTLWVLLALWVVSTPGCSGCRFWSKTTAESEEEKKKKEEEKKKKKKPDFEVELLVSQPNPIFPSSCWLKPGHWTATTLATKTNNFDFHGDLDITVLDGNQRPRQLLGVPFSITTTRKVALQKGRKKHLESMLFVSPTPEKYRVKTELSPRRGVLGWPGNPQPLSVMPEYQYHFVVIARRKESYGYVKMLDSVRTPNDLAVESLSPEKAYYRVHLIDGTKRNLLPSHGLFWTSIAYVLWDDVDPDLLRPEQRRAIVDWLHWGGQLILSGPDSLETLDGSFLAPYLPATSTGTRELTEDDFSELNANWTLPVRGKEGVPLQLVKPWSGVEVELHPDAREVPNTGGLVVERRIGRGRIIASVFRLSQRGLRNWSGCDGLFNGCLMGRPPRRFHGSEFELGVTWADARGGKDSCLDPRRTCNLRYFSRDVGRSIQLPQSMEETLYSGPTYSEVDESVTLGSDVASWNDFNSSAAAARQTLDEVARVEVPDRSFVIWVVGAYLMVLVPLNWMFFKLIGRIEWAWAAAPLIAIACTGMVIRLARLDIGFARSITEIAVVETQSDYPRAHVTRYTALYTSLSTGYELSSDDPGTQILPFPSDREGDSNRFGSTHLTYHYGKDMALDGFRVSSNSTAVTHCEQMVDLGGPISLITDEWGTLLVWNQTEYPIRDAGVLRLDENGEFQTAWVGTVPPGKSAAVHLIPQFVEPSSDVSLWKKERHNAADSLDEEANLQNLAQLFRLAEQSSQLKLGQTRLVGWSDVKIPGLHISPGAAQQRHMNLIVANLEYPFGADAQPDVNTRADFDRLPPKSITPEFMNP